MWLRTINIADKRHLPAALAHFADHFAVGVQVALAPTFRAIAVEQRPGASTHGAGNRDAKCLKACAAASRAFDNSWPSHK